MVSDTMPGAPFRQGNNFSVSAACESVQAEIAMPLQETFWAVRFGMPKDRFGIRWMFNLDKDK